MDFLKTSEDTEMRESLDNVSADLKVAQDVVNPIIEEVIGSSSFTPTDKHGDRKIESIINSNDFTGELTGYESVWIEAMNSDREEEVEVRNEKETENHDQIAKLTKALEKAQQELADKEKMIAEKEKQVNEFHQLYLQKHEELCMSRDDVQRLYTEMEQQKEQAALNHNKSLDDEAARLIAGNLQESPDVNEHVKTLEAECARLRDLTNGQSDASPYSAIQEELRKANQACDDAYRLMGKNQTMHQQELDKAQTALTKMVEETDLKTKDLEGKVNLLTNQRNDAERRLANLTQVTYEVNNSCIDLTAECETLRNQSETLSANINQYLEHIEELKAGNEGLQDILASQEGTTHNFDVAPKVTDEEVICIWRCLYSEVIVLCSVLKRKPHMGELSTHHDELFKAIMPTQSTIHWSQYLEDDEHRQFLVEALIWENIVRYFDFNKVWLGKVGVDLKATLTQMRDGLTKQSPVDWSDLKKYCVWRAQAAHQFVRFGSHDDMQAHLDAAAQFMNILRPFCSLQPWSGQNNIEFKEIYDGVSAILASCQKLDHVFMSSLAHWKPRLNRSHNVWHSKLHDHPEWFGNVKHVPGELTFGIAFQVAPTLARNGDLDGEEHGHTEVLVKGSVMPAVRF